MERIPNLIEYDYKNDAAISIFSFIFSKIIFDPHMSIGIGSIILVLHLEWLINPLLNDY